MCNFIKINLVWSGDGFGILESLAETFFLCFALSYLGLLHRIYL